LEWSSLEEEVSLKHIIEEKIGGGREETERQG
jgi:hypothetical protein